MKKHSKILSSAIICASLLFINAVSVFAANGSSTPRPLPTPAILALLVCIGGWVAAGLYQTKKADDEAVEVLADAYSKKEEMSEEEYNALINKLVAPVEDESEKKNSFLKFWE